MTTSTHAHIAAKRARLTKELAARRKAHAPRMAVAQQLKRATTRLLEVELAEQRRRERAAAKGATPGTLAGDLFTLCT
ncbi:hypothetical protein [Ancylobacter sp. SL191]|uniref:hypothetical protein n=1 Tax=Ancylobacter sp. SL191 TaxID=2995166 RepID=UPI00226E1519|nr:hypothetical protein [Ancylobacter sp. SL191]WAC26392.1 hypothetical protein OU996_15405 [Ancylobacter sp. SL191]